MEAVKNSDCLKMQDLEQKVKVLLSEQKFLKKDEFENLVGIYVKSMIDVEKFMKTEEFGSKLESETEEFGSKLVSELESHLKPLLDTENFMKTD